MSKKMTKAMRILAAVRRGHQGKTASELAKVAKVDHNHVYIMEKLVQDGALKRKGGNQRELEPFDKAFKGGRGVTYWPGRKFDELAPKVRGGNNKTQTANTSNETVADVTNENPPAAVEPAPIETPVALQEVPATETVTA